MMLKWIRIVCFIYCGIIIAVESGPVCDEAYAYIEVAEDTPIGTVVKEIKCSRSPSASGDLTYAIKDGNTNGKFGVNSTGGLGYVFVYQSISYESRTTSFQLSIEVSETTPYRASVNFVLDIQVTGVNDYAPLFLFSPYTVYINEDVGPGTIISKPIPYDFDKGNDGSTTSSIIDGDDSQFYMDPKTAKVYLRKDLDYERQTDYVITIQVTDDGIPERRSSTSIINVHVKDVNDNPPICEDTYLTETFEETKEEGAVIRFIKCTDADAGNNGRLSYTIAEGDYTKFRLQGPYLILSKQVDVDTEPKVWTLSVRVRDRGNPRLSTRVDIVLYVEGVDDNSPIWAPPYNGQYVIDLEENTPIGSKVIQISANDQDKSDSMDAAVVYYMDDYTHYFTIKPKTGDIFLNHKLDREKVSSYKLPVSAVSIDNPSDRITSDVIINIKDVNDFTPEFEKDVFQYFIQEDVSLQTEVANITATDLDVGENGEILYMIIDGNVDSVFDIDSKTGLITVVGRCDYESEIVYSILVRAMDRGRPARSATCTVIVSIIPVNEFEPLARSMDAVDILEDTFIGQSVFKIEASDGDRGLDGQLEYSLASMKDIFAVEPTTGIIRLLHELDRETISEYKVVINVSDKSETQRKSTTVTVTVNVLDVNDNAPACRMFYAETLIPPINSGDAILKLNCTDNDDGQNSKLSYTILSGNTNSDISISYDGDLTVLRNPTAAEYRIEIEVRDGGTPFLSTNAIAVITTGSKPQFKNLPGSVGVFENASIGSPIFNVESISVSKQIRYTIEATEANFDNMDTFRIDSFTGIVYCWRELDREVRERFSLTVRATDLISGIQADSTLTINTLDVNDNKPMFDQAIYNVSIVENVEPRTSLFKVSVTDRDTGDNGRFVITLDESGKDVFYIDEQGAIITRSSIDREKTDRFTLVLTAVDQGQDTRLTASATALIFVLDSDEYAPEFVDVGSDLETRLSEDTALGSKIFVIEARDFDAKSKLTYSLWSGADSNFIIDKASGSIYLSKSLDREENDIYQLVVEVIDDGKKTATTTVTIIVTDVNDNDPVFETQVFKFDVEESSEVGHVIGSVGVTDKDTNQNGDVFLSLEKGNIDGVFDIKDNKILLSGPLDYEKLNQYHLGVKAVDNGYPRRTSTATVILEVIPVLKKPVFVTDDKSVNIPENAYIGYLVFDCEAILLGFEEENANDFVYSLLSGNENGMFGLDKKTGQITIARTLDRELNGDSHQMKIMASNIYNNNLRADFSLDVLVDDVNDNQPEFVNDRYTFDVKENEGVGHVIGRVSAEDKDFGQNAKISYEISGGPEIQETFAVDILTGEISLKRRINYHYEQTFHFSIIAYDLGSPSLNSKALLTVNVIDINDNAPVFDQQSLTVSVRENVKPGKQVYQVNAKDDDAGINSELLFRIVKGNYDGCFELDSESGELTTSKLLDREKNDIFELLIEAEDKGSPSLTGSSTLTVIVLDVNDNVPEFERSVFTVSLNRFTPIETSVITVAATDNDIGDNALIDYQLSGDNQELFQVDSTSGRVYTFADLSSLENGIEVTVISKDRGRPRLSSSTLIDVQLHPTKFKDIEDYSFTVSEYDPPNTFIGTLGTKSGMKYSIEKGNFKNNIRISNEDGNLFLRGILDREEYSDYFLVVNTFHRLTPNLEYKIHVHIKVSDENDNSPEFPDGEYAFFVLEHTPVDFSVAQISALDRDTGENGNITYLIMEEEADELFSIDLSGIIRMKETISYQAVSKLNFTVVARDNGQFSRSGSTHVLINVVDVDESSFHQGSGRRSKLLSAQIPVGSATGYVVTKLTPEDFGFAVRNSNVRYYAHDTGKVFRIDEISGDIVLRKPDSITPGSSFWLWVVATVLGNDAGKESMALIKMESFQPGRHVVVLTHAVSAHILDINRNLFQEQLQKSFPDSFPVVWKLEDDNKFLRRRLLQFNNAKSYVYFLRSNDTTFDARFDADERFVHQDEVMYMLTDKNGDVTDKLNTEAYDNFPIISVSRYTARNTDEQPWLQTTNGKIVICVCVVLLLLILAITIGFLVVKKSNNGIMGKMRVCGINDITPHPKPVEQFYNNIKTTASSKDTVPVMETLRLMSKMSESERNEILQKAFSLKETDDILAANSNLNEARPSTVVYSIQDETKPSIQRKISNEEAVFQTKMNVNNNDLSGRMNGNSSTVETNNPDVRTEETRPTDESELKTSAEQMKQTRRRSTLTSGSVSSLDLDSKPDVPETASQSEVVVNEPIVEPILNTRQENNTNRTLIIGGKEYDGVGKDTKTNGKYLYNTRTGDKLHVSDDILKRAIERRQSVVHADSNEVPHGRVSTFKRPLQRKMSRSRFSTTTIWEMSVDLENGTKSQDGSSDHVFVENNDQNDDTNQDISERKHRRFGIDVSSKGKQTPADLLDECDSESAQIEELETHNRGLNNANIGQNNLDSDDTTESDESDPFDSSDDGKITEKITAPEFDAAVNVEEGNDILGRKIGANMKWDKLLADTVQKPENCEAQNDQSANRWTKAQKIVKYVRPVYKPINLDNVTCKVPKGKSDPKDCLSKDPVYAGWAKLVGRRMKKKVVKTKDGPSKTVVSREGRSLPASLFATQASSQTQVVQEKPKPRDVVTYTKIISSLTPPHLAKKRMSIGTS